MSLNERFGRGGSSANKLSINSAPDINLLRKLVNDLSDAKTSSQVDISWKIGDEYFTLCLTHSRVSVRADWKLYRGQGSQATLLWNHATNDLNSVHRWLAEAHQQARPSSSHIGLAALPVDQNLPQERRAININGNLSGNLRKLFIGAQEEAGFAAKFLPSVKKEPGVGKQTIVKHPTVKRATEFIDISPGRDILQNLFIGQFGIFSYPTFLFFLEREYFQAIENKTPLTLVIFKIIGASGSIDINDLQKNALQELTRRIKHTQRRTDILAQYENDKLAMLLPETDNAGAKTFVNRIQKALSKAPLTANLANDSIKFSFGIATLGEHCNSLHAFLTYADKALNRGHELGKEIFSDQDVIAEQSFNKGEIKSIDLTAAQELVAKLISNGIFTYRAFLAFLDQEYQRAARKERDLFVMVLKLRVYEETFDDPVNMLEGPASYEVIRRIGSLLNKRDIFAHYLSGNFIIMRPNMTASQMDTFSNKIVQKIMSEEWLTPECPSSSLRIHTQVFTARTHPTAANLFCFVPAVLNNAPALD